MIEVRNHFRKLSKLLTAQADVAGGTGHSGTTGSLRELLIQRFLRPHLPAHVSIRAGVIIDSAGNRSSQQDCVIVDGRFPLIDIGSDTEALILAESVLATVEVKSFLDKDRLLTSLTDAMSTKRLRRHGEQLYRKGPAEIRTPKSHPILTYIFAYDGLRGVIPRRGIRRLVRRVADPDLGG
jgi:hypothetical protein